MPARPSYKKAIQYLYSLEKYGIRLGLKRIKTFLKSLGNPQDRLNLIHVAGTNGKGSTCALIESVLIRAGYKVGLYTSPHLVRFNERIRINEREITDKKVAELVKRIKQRSGETEKWRNGETTKQNPRFPDSPIPRLPCALTFFEFTTAMAFLYFAEEGVDFAVMEVGLGGRLDATNVGSPLVSVITNVAKDHEAFLGKRIRDIAFEKAGIIKKDGILISAEAKPAALKVLKDECKRKEARFYRINKDFFVYQNKTISYQLSAMGGFTFEGRRWILKDLKTNLLGRHQLFNCACALAAAEVLEEKGYRIPESAIRRGLQDTFWPGRLEILSRKPLIVLDCAHNPAGAEVLREAFIDLRKRKIISHIGHIRHIFLVLGIMADKDIKGIISALAPIADTVILTCPKTERAASLEMLYKEIMDLRVMNYELRMKDSNRKSKILNRKLKIMLIEDVQEACRTAISMSKAGDMVCITGSIFTVGEARETLRQMQIANCKGQNVKLKKGKR